MGSDRVVVPDPANAASYLLWPTVFWVVGYLALFGGSSYACYHFGVCSKAKSLCSSTETTTTSTVEFQVYEKSGKVEEGTTVSEQAGEGDDEVEQEETSEGEKKT